MAKGIFTDKNKKLSEQELKNVLGQSIFLWDSILEFISSNFKTSNSYKFYGKNFGWALNFKKSSKSLISLYPSENVFTAQIILKDELIKKLPARMMTAKIKKAITNAYPYSEGRWLFIPVETEKDVEIIKRLIKIKTDIN